MSSGALQSIDFGFVARKEVRAMFTKLMEGSLQVTNGCLATGLRLLGVVMVVVVVHLSSEGENNRDHDIVLLWKPGGWPRA